MKKTLLLIMLSNLSISYLDAQVNSTERFITQSAHTPTNIERYKIDYQLLDESIISDSKEILLSLNLDQFEGLRLEDEDIQLVDKGTGIVIIFYSYSKCAINKNNSHYAPATTK